MVPPQVWDPETYDAARRRLVPDFDAFYGTAALVVARCAPVSPRILDLGAGTGLLSQAVADRVRAPRLTLHDASTSMLDVARVRLAAHEPHFCVGSLQDALPPGPFDAVVSALSIHHLAESEKRELFGKAFSVLAPGGVFVNADQVAGPSGWHDRIYRRCIGLCPNLLARMTRNGRARRSGCGLTSTRRLMPSCSGWVRQDSNWATVSSSGSGLRYLRRGGPAVRAGHDPPLERIAAAVYFSRGRAPARPLNGITLCLRHRDNLAGRARWRIGRSRIASSSGRRRRRARPGR